jgi:hypothetical protein
VRIVARRLHDPRPAAKLPAPASKAQRQHKVIVQSFIAGGTTALVQLHKARQQDQAARQVEMDARQRAKEAQERAASNLKMAQETVDFLNTRLDEDPMKK